MTTKKLPAVKSTKFKPGVSGNPAGRKKGTKNKTTLIKQAIEQSLVEEVEADMIAVARKSLEMALNENEAMIKMWMDKFIPNARMDQNGDNGKFSGLINIIINGEQSPIINVEKEEDEQ